MTLAVIDSATIPLQNINAISNTVRTSFENVDSALRPVNLNIGSLSNTALSTADSIGTLRSGLNPAKDGISAINNQALEASSSFASFSENLDKTDVAASKLSGGGLSQGLAALSRSGSKIESVMSMMDRYEISQLTLANSTSALESAQIRYNKTVSTYGKNSKEAVIAQNNLERAQNQQDKTQTRVTSSNVILGLRMMSHTAELIEYYNKGQMVTDMMKAANTVRAITIALFKKETWVTAYNTLSKIPNTIATTANAAALWIRTGSTVASTSATAGNTAVTAANTVATKINTLSFWGNLRAKVAVNVANARSVLISAGATTAMYAGAVAAGVMATANSVLAAATWAVAIPILAIEAPVWAVVAAVAAVIAVVYDLYQAFTGGHSYIADFAGALVKGFSGILDFVSNINWSGILGIFLKAGKAMIGALVSGITSGISKVMSALVSVMKRVSKVIMPVILRIVEIIFPTIRELGYIVRAIERMRIATPAASISPAAISPSIPAAAISPTLAAVNPSIPSVTGIAGMRDVNVNVSFSGANISGDPKSLQSMATMTANEVEKTMMRLLNSQTNRAGIGK